MEWEREIEGAKTAMVQGRVVQRKGMDSERECSSFDEQLFMLQVRDLKQ